MKKIEILIKDDATMPVGEILESVSKGIENGKEQESTSQYAWQTDHVEG